MSVILRDAKGIRRLTRRIPVKGRQAIVTDWALLRPVLLMMSQGYTYAEMGAWLYVSEEGIKSRARSICALLGARDKAHAVAIAFHTGLLTPDPIGARP